MKNSILFAENETDVFSALLRMARFLGGKGGGNNAAQAAEKERRAREARIAENSGRINSAIDSGQGQRLDRVQQSVLDFFYPQLAEDQNKASRNVRFEVARRGGTGGSQEIDALAELQRKEDLARENIGTAGIQARDAARQGDERTRANLLSQAQSDINGESLVSSALQSLSGNTQAAVANAKAQNLGDFFDGSANLFSNVELSRGIDQGRQALLQQLQNKQRSSFDPASFQGSIFTN